MCVELTIFRPGAEALRTETQGELAGALGGGFPLLPEYLLRSRGDDDCLCPIDLPALAARVGATLTAPDWGAPTDRGGKWRMWLPR